MSIGRHAQYEALLTASGANAIKALHSSRDEVFDELDAIGTHEISEQLALGRLPAEVALSYGVPVLHFRAWMRERITEEEITEIRSAAAESLQVKSVFVLSADLKNPAEASQAKALSERLAKQAEALDPAAWSAGHLVPQRVMPVINISFSSPTGVDMASVQVVQHQQVEPVRPTLESCARTHDSDPTDVYASSVGSHPRPRITPPAVPLGIDITAPQPREPRKAGW